MNVYEKKISFILKATWMFRKDFLNLFQEQPTYLEKKKFILKATQMFTKKNFDLF